MALTNTAYWWGDNPGRNQARCLGCGNREGAALTDSVGSFGPNAFGLHDVHGNVSEWVEDCYHDNYRGAPGDGSAWIEGGDCSRRVVRGGSWLNESRDIRSAFRSGRTIGNRYGYEGLRVARTLTP